MYKIKFDLPNMAQGAEFGVGGLGMFKNGEEYVIDDEQAEAFRAYNQSFDTVEGHKLENNEGEMVPVPHYEVVNGPTVLQAFQGIEGVTVETYEEKKTAKKAVVSEGGE